MPPGARGLLRRAGRRLFRAQGRNADAAAGTGLLDLFARRRAAAARRQAAADAPQRLDDQRRRNRLSRPELPEPAAHRAHRPAPLPPQRDDGDAAAGAEGANEPRRNSRARAGLRDHPRHPRRLAARGRPRRDRSRDARSTISSPPSTPASRRSTAPTSTPASRSSTARCAQRLRATRGDEAARAAACPHQARARPLDRCRRFDARDVEAIVDRSLPRLGVERLDLVQFHWWDYAEPRWLEALGWLDDLRRAGKMRHDRRHQFRHAACARDPRRRHSARLDAGAIFRARPAAGERLRRSLPRARRRAALLWLGGGRLPVGSLARRGRSRAAPLANRSLIKYKLIIDDFGGWALFQELLRALRRVADRHGADIASVASRSDARLSRRRRGRSSARLRARISPPTSPPRRSTSDRRGPRRDRERSRAGGEGRSATSTSSSATATAGTARS